MTDAFEANYVPRDEGWTITVTGRGKTLTATAQDILAARGQADQLAKKLAAKGRRHTVVHLLNGDPVQFTSSYLTARLSTPEPPAARRGTSRTRSTSARKRANPA